MHATQSTLLGSRMLSCIMRRALYKMKLGACVGCLPPVAVSSRRLVMAPSGGWETHVLLLVSLLLVGGTLCGASEEESGQQLLVSGTDDKKHLFPHYSPNGGYPGDHSGATGPHGPPASSRPNPPAYPPSHPDKPHKRHHKRHHRQDSDKSATTLGRKLLEDVVSEELVGDAEGEFEEENAAEEVGALSTTVTAPKPNGTATGTAPPARTHHRHPVRHHHKRHHQHLQGGGGTAAQAPFPHNPKHPHQLGHLPPPGHAPKNNPYLHKPPHSTEN